MTWVRRWIGTAFKGNCKFRGEECGWWMLPTMTVGIQRGRGCLSTSPIGEGFLAEEKPPSFEKSFSQPWLWRAVQPVSIIHSKTVPCALRLSEAREVTLGSCPHAITHGYGPVTKHFCKMKPKNCPLVLER